MRFGPSVGRRVRLRLKQAVQRLATFPGIGHPRSDLTDDPALRFWPVGPTLIAYRLVEHRRIEVLLIERAERDWQRLLEDEVP